MHIAFVIEHFNRQQGGAEQYAWGLARWLVNQGHSLHIFTCSAPVDPDFECLITRLDVKQARKNSKQQRMAHVFTQALQEHTFDIIQGFNHVLPCDVLRLGGGVHRAFEQYNLLSVPHPLAQTIKKILVAVQPKYRALRQHEMLQFADPHRHFIAISQRVADDMKTHYPAVADRIHLIRNGVDCSRFNPDALKAYRQTTRDRLGLADHMDVLLFVSNNYRLKGLHDLLRALSKVVKTSEKPVTLLVVGRGDSRAYTKQIHCSGLKQHVQFIGPVTDPVAYYAAADALVHPSYYDAYGFVGLEAMACGLPVVISRNCGVSEIMQQGRGAILVDMPCTKEALASAIKQVLKPAFRTAARDLNRTLAEQYPLENNYQQVAALYQHLL